MARMDELPEKKLSDQKLNEWLKVLGATARIDRIELTNHIGRHSYGCILAEMDIPIDIAQKMLGHRDRRSTEWYYKIRQHKLDDAADRLNGM